MKRILERVDPSWLPIGIMLLIPVILLVSSVVETRVEIIGPAKELKLTWETVELTAWKKCFGGVKGEAEGFVVSVCPSASETGFRLRARRAAHPGLISDKVEGWSGLAFRVWDIFGNEAIFKIERNGTYFWVFVAQK